MTRYAGKTLLVVPSCPFAAYEAKGTAGWLERYYNPGQAFDTVHAFSPFETGSRKAYGMTIHGAPRKQFSSIVERVQPDVVRAYGGFWPSRVALTRTPSHVPVIVSVHDSRPYFARPFIRFADLVLCVSHAVRDRVLQCGTPGERIRLLPNRIDLNIFHPRREHETKDISQRFAGGKHLLFVGRFSKEKNVDTVMRALLHLPREYRSVFLGPGDFTPYQRLAQAIGVADRCHWISAMNNEELPKWYSWCDCFCAPSRSEGFGLVFAEAAACGAAIVTSDVAPINEILRHDESAYLVRDYENPEAMAIAIRAVCENPEQRRRITTGALAAAQRYGHERIDALEVEYYGEALAAPASRGMLVPWQVRASKAVFAWQRLLGKYREAA